MKSVDLNCDLGESFGAYKIGRDEDVLPLISSANIACGWHAGDAVVMSRTVKAAAEAGVAVGAHPGFPDLAGFGRRNMNITPSEAKAYVQYQMGALNAFCRAYGVKLQHVKPHGALYNMAAKDETLAMAICEGIASVSEDIILLGLSGSAMETAAEKCSVKFASEVFADRAYEEDGTLVARSKPGAVITDENEAIKRVVEMVSNGTVTSASGKIITIKADSICVHGDNEHALEFVKLIRAKLEENGIDIKPIGKVIG